MVWQVKSDERKADQSEPMVWQVERAMEVCCCTKCVVWGECYELK